MTLLIIVGWIIIFSSRTVIKNIDNEYFKVKIVKKEGKYINLYLNWKDVGRFLIFRLLKLKINLERFWTSQNQITHFIFEKSRKLPPVDKRMVVKLIDLCWAG